MHPTSAESHFRPDQPIGESFWDCSICHVSMEEDVAISDKCYHIFHRECIEPWLRQKLTCPLCNCETLPQNYVDNPDYIEQYQKWNQDREGYTVKRAFEEEYGELTPDTNGFMRVNADFGSGEEVRLLQYTDLLKPANLRGKEQQRERTVNLDDLDCIHSVNFLAHCVCLVAQSIFTLIGNFFLCVFGVVDDDDCEYIFHQIGHRIDTLFLEFGV